MNTLEEKKITLFKQMIYKVIEEQNLNNDFKSLISERDFLSKYYDVFQNISKKTAERESISEEFINEQFGIVSEYTEKSQLEISEQLHDLYATHSMNKEMTKFQMDRNKGFMFAYSKFTSALNLLKLKLEKISFFSVKNDPHELKDVIDSFTDTTNIIHLDLEGFDDLILEKGTVVGFLASTGSGKSAVVQFLHAKMVDKYKVAHFSLELSKKLLMKRMIGSLGIYPMKELNNITTSEKEKIYRRFSKFQKDQLFITVQHGKINLDKIEKVIIQEEPEVVIIDYVQKLNEKFDPNSSEATVTQILNEFAVKYNVLIIITIQTNDSGRDIKSKDENELDDIPTASHIARMKSIADDLTTLVALKSKKRMSKQNLTEFTFVTRKTRNDNYCSFSYLADVNIGEWELYGSVDMNAKQEGNSISNFLLNE